MKEHGGEVKQPYGFTGREWDKETGLYYYRARYYDPKGGRFIGKDPIGFNGGDVNLYRYVSNNPVNWRDPSGLDAEVCIRPVQIPLMPGDHCFVRFNKDNKETRSFDPKGVHPDPAPEKATSCTPTKGPQDDDCVKKEMDKCKGYDYTGNNCCHCAENALKACGQSIPVKKWPNWPINPGPQPGEIGYTP